MPVESTEPSRGRKRKLRWCLRSLVRPLLAAGAAVLLTAGAVHPAFAAAPPPGAYTARLCVQTFGDPGQVPDCGPAAAWVQPNQRVRLQISDIEYRFQLHSSQVDVVLMHGSMQIDGFTANYDWHGSTLRFTDLEKRTRYEVQFLAPLRGGR